MGGDANGSYCSFKAVTIHLRQLLFIRVDCIVSCLGGRLHGWSCSYEYFFLPPLWSQK